MTVLSDWRDRRDKYDWSFLSRVQGVTCLPVYAAVRAARCVLDFLRVPWAVGSWIDYRLTRLTDIADPLVDHKLALYGLDAELYMADILSKEQFDAWLAGKAIPS